MLIFLCFLGTSPISLDYFKQVRIYGTNYDTHTSSLLCWGVDQILIVYQTYLIMRNNYSPEMESSCLNPGTFMNVSTSSIINSPCGNGRIFEYPMKLDLNRLNQVTKIFLNKIKHNLIDYF